MNTEQREDHTPPDPYPPVGGGFLLRQTDPALTFIPEDLDTEARLIGQTMRDFVRRDVLPLADRLEAQEPGEMQGLVWKAGELGLLALNVPERFGGLNLPKSVAALLSEEAAVHPGFSLSIGVHSGVATLPLVLFGTEQQKEQYLPRLASGEMIGAFALSEANSGSDALAAECRATLSPDGHYYLLNGTKFWITNGGFADLFTVFAKIDGAHFTAFLVERGFQGVSVGPEERKMGLKASSTCRLLLENCRVPVGNVLGEVGKGARVALYALNPGRFSIGASALGMGKANLRIATQYAMQRVQFGKPIIDHGLIQQKLAEMAVRLFALESMVYRVAGWWDSLLHAVDTSTAEGVAALRSAFEEYAIECAIIKVYGTETLDYIVDESLQIHGGFGYSEEFPAARAYRDARVYRIFEGTNEINRLTIADQIRRRVQNGRLDWESGEPFSADLVDVLPLPDHFPARSEDIRIYLRAIRTAVVAACKGIYDDGAQEIEEIAAEQADMLITLFVVDSVWCRIEKLANQAPPPETVITALAAGRLAERGAAQVLDRLPVILGSLRSIGNIDLSQALSRLLVPLIHNSLPYSWLVAKAVEKRQGYPF